MVPYSHGRLLPEAVLTGPRNEDRYLKPRKSSLRANRLTGSWRSGRGRVFLGARRTQSTASASYQTLEPPVGQYLADTQDKHQDDYGVEVRQTLQTAKRKPLEEFSDWKLGSGQGQESLSEVCNHRPWWQWQLSKHSTWHLNSEDSLQVSILLSTHAVCRGHDDLHVSVAANLWHRTLSCPWVCYNARLWQTGCRDASNKPIRGHTRIWKGKHALHTNPHQQETLIQPYKYYLTITKKKLQITNPLDFQRKNSP